MNIVWVLCVAVLAGCATPAGRGPAPVPPAAPAWSMEGGDAGRTSASRFPAPHDWDAYRSTALVERPGLAPEEYATPLALGDALVVGSSQGDLVALDFDGGTRWRFAAGGRIYTTAAYGDGLVYFGTDEGALVAVNLAGEEVWRFPTQYPVVASPLFVDGKVYVPVADQNVFCIEAATGRPLWQYGRKFPRHNSLWRALGLCYGAGRVYAGFSDGAVVALDAEVGRVEWRADVGTPELFGDLTAGPSFRDGRVYAGVFRGPVVCLRADTGEEVWRRDVEAATGFAVGADRVYLGTAGGAAAALAAADGSVAWTTALDGGVPTDPVLAGDTVIVGASEGSLFGLDAATGREVNRFTPGPGLHAQPLLFEGGLVFLSDRGVLHWLR